MDDYLMKLKQTQLEAYLHAEFNPMINRKLDAYNTTSLNFEFRIGKRFKIDAKIPTIYSNLGFYMNIADEEVARIQVFGIVLINGIELNKQFEVIYINNEGFRPTLDILIKEATSMYELISTTERKMKEDSFFSVDRIANTQYNVDEVSTPIVDQRITRLIANLNMLNYKASVAERIAIQTINLYPEEQDLDTLTHAALSLPV